MRLRSVAPRVGGLTRSSAKPAEKFVNSARSHRMEPDTATWPSPSHVPVPGLVLWSEHAERRRTIWAPPH